MSTGSTQPLTEIRTRNISRGDKGGRCVGLTNFQTSCAECLEIWEPQTPGNLLSLSRTVKGELYLYFTRRMIEGIHIYIYIYLYFVYCGIILCVLLSSSVYLLYYVCIALLHTLVDRLLARSQYSEGPATGHLDTGFTRFPCVYKQMLRWFPTFQVATTCFSCSPPDLNLLDPYFIFMYMHNNHCQRVSVHLHLNILLLLLLMNVYKN